MSMTQGSPGVYASQPATAWKDMGHGGLRLIGIYGSWKSPRRLHLVVNRRGEVRETYSMPVMFKSIVQILSKNEPRQALNSGILHNMCNVAIRVVAYLARLRLYPMWKPQRGRRLYAAALSESRAVDLVRALPFMYTEAEESGYRQLHLAGRCFSLGRATDSLKGSCALTSSRAMR